MGFLSKLFGRKEERANINDPNVPLTAENVWGYVHGRGGESQSGQFVNDYTALTYSPIWSGIWMISEDVAKLPLLTYRREEDGDRERAMDHPVYPILRRHTGQMTSFEWVATMIVNAILYGHGITRIIRGIEGRPIGLLFYERSKWTIDSDDFYPTYRLTDPDGVQRYYPEGEIIDLVSWTLNGWEGLSLLDYAKDAIGRALAAEQFGDEFYSQGHLPGGWFMHPEGGREMSEAAITRFLNRATEKHTKREPFGFLREGMDFKQNMLNAQEAMLIEALNFSVKDAARFLKMPPHKLGDDTRTSYNSVEQENRSYLETTLQPWMTKLEYHINLKMFNRWEKSKQKVFSEFETKAFLRGSTIDRFNAYNIGVNTGFLTRNEARQAENLNRIDGLDEPLQPMNMQTVDQANAAAEAQLQQSQAPPEDMEATGDQGRDPEGQFARSNDADRRAIVRDVINDELRKSMKRLAFVANKDSYDPGEQQLLITSDLRNVSRLLQNYHQRGDADRISCHLANRIVGLVGEVKQNDQKPVDVIDQLFGECSTMASELVEG